MLPSCPIHTLASAYLVTESQHTHSLLTVLSTYSFYCIKSTHSYTSPTYITRYTFVYTHMSSHSTSKKAFFQINPKIVIFDSNMFSKHTLCLGKFHLRSVTHGCIHKSTKTDSPGHLCYPLVQFTHSPIWLQRASTCTFS